MTGRPHSAAKAIVPPRPALVGFDAVLKQIVPLTYISTHLRTRIFIRTDEIKKNLDGRSASSAESHDPASGILFRGH